MSAETEGQEWIARPERSHILVIRSYVWIARHLGRSVSRLLLYPICLYFLIFSPKARRASRDYLTKVLPYRPRLVHLFRHYFVFASTLLDRVYLLNNQTELFDVRIHGEDFLTGIIAQGLGCFLVGSHVGSFEIIRALGRKQRDLRICLLMYEENARKTNAVLNAINPALGFEIIRLGTFDSMLKVQESLSRGDLVGMLADRTLKGTGQIQCPFLGQTASFSLGPFRLAAILRQPVILMFGLYRGGRSYDIYFEPLATPFSDGTPSHNTDFPESATRHYAKRLEHFCRMAPYNWFNFFDFWKRDGT